jgi:hypothetical protein
MGMRRPRVEELLQRAHSEPTDRSEHGRRLAIIQCHHGGRRSVIAEVRGFTVMSTVWPGDLPHDLRFASYDVIVHCTTCGRGAVLDLGQLRAKMREPYHGLLKLNIDDVSRAG